MNENSLDIDNEDQNEKSPSNKTWGDRIKSSLMIGLIFSGLWMILMHVTGQYNIFAGGAAQLSTFFGNAFGIFSVLSGFAFIVKVIFFFFKKKKHY